MKYPSQKALENESRNEFTRIIPSNWIVEDIDEDYYGIDFQITIVNDEKITNNVFWVQIKSTEKVNKKERISLSFTKEHLEYYEKCKLPLIIVLWNKPENKFYFIFAQEYIKSVLSISNPLWRNQKSSTIYFSPDSVLNDVNRLKSVVIQGYFFILQQELKNVFGENSATYWTGDIPQSDNYELIFKFLDAMTLLKNNDLEKAKKSFENILDTCTLAPKEKVAVLVNLSVIYSHMGEYDASENKIESVLELSTKLDVESKNEVKGVAFTNLGVILFYKGEMNRSKQSYLNALPLIDENDFMGIASLNRNLGNVERVSGNIEEALNWHNKSLEIFKKINFMNGISGELGNIALIHIDKKEYNIAKKLLLESILIAENLNDKKLLADQYGNLGFLYQIKGDLNKALNYHKKALDIDLELKFIHGLIKDFRNLGATFHDMFDLMPSLKCYTDALNLALDVDNKYDAAELYRNIGNVLMDLGNHMKIFLDDDKLRSDNKDVIDELTEKYFGDKNKDFVLKNTPEMMSQVLNDALEHYEESIKISEKIGNERIIAECLGNMGLVYRIKEEYSIAMEYLDKSLKKCDQLGLIESKVQLMHGKAITFHLMDDNKEALSILKKALKIAKKNGFKDMIIIKKAIKQLKQKMSNSNY